MAIDDICPGDFAPEPMILVTMAVGQERIDWRALERRVLAGVGWTHFGPVTEIRDVYFGERRVGCRCGQRGCAQDIDPDQPGADPDAYSFSIGPDTLDNCPTCKGTGEISEYPADDDERLVACPTCGGTGEIWE